MIQQPQIYAVQSTADIPKDQFSRMCMGLTKERQSKIGRFMRYEDAQRSMLAEVLLRRLVYQYTGLHSEAVILKTNEYGKPFLVGKPDFHFNISHAGEWVVCAVDCQPVGVDIERIKSAGMGSEEIAKKFFSAGEYEAMLEMPEADRVTRFFELWTLKESYIKAVGKGLSIALDSFSLQIQQDGSINFHSRNQAQGWYFRQYEIARGYKMALCRVQNQFPEKVHIWEIDGLLGE
jgi:4'-phosphopantetheinyl transferase